MGMQAKKTTEKDKWLRKTLNRKLKNAKPPEDECETQRWRRRLSRSR
jgi:hypothetical protein